MKNKHRSLLALGLTMLLMTGCGQSEAAKAVDTQISAIGEVNLDSGELIAAAEAAVSGLSEEDHKQLKNEQVLKDARLAYEGLVKQDQADEIDEKIASVGEVKIESEEQIAAARDLYEKASEEVKALVKNADQLTAAEDELMRLKEEEAVRQEQMKIKEAEDMITAIGEVTLESKDAIDGAQEVYEKLSDEQKQKVSNAGDLEAAIVRLEELKKEQAETLLAGMKKEEDAFQSVDWYYPEGWRFYSDGSWVADQNCFIMPYLGKTDDDVWMRLVYNYTADDWVFFTNVIVLADGEKFTKSFSYYDVVRDNGGGRIWEYVDAEVGGSDIEMLWAIANSEETMVRFEGRDYVDDYTVKDREKEAIRQALLAYEALQ